MLSLCLCMLYNLKLESFLAQFHTKDLSCVRHHHYYIRYILDVLLHNLQ